MPPVKVLLGPGKVNPAVGRPMVGFLKKDVGTDAGFFQKAIIVYSGGGNVPFLQSAEILYGQGGEVHAYAPAGAGSLFPARSRPDSMPGGSPLYWIVGMRSTGTHWNRGWRCTEEQKGQSCFRRSLPSRIWPYETVRPVNPVSERP